MTSQPIPVLFTHFGGEAVLGSERVLLDLLAHLDRNLVQPVVWCNAEAMAEACRAMQVLTYRSAFEFWFDYQCPPFSPRRYARLVAEGSRIVRRHGIRVLHANSAAPSQWLAPVAMITGRPLLAHLHIGYLRRSRYALLLHLADLVVGVSRQVIEGLREDGMAPDRLRVIYNGIDFRRIRSPGGSLRARLGIAPDAPVVASIGSLTHRKGHDLLLRAMAKLSGPDAPVHLVIGGDGKERAGLEALARTLGLAARTHFLGHVVDVASVYRTADVFALASRADSFGLVLAEAGHFGLPVVSTRVDGIPEVVAEGESGLLVPPDDADALATAIARLIGDPVERRRIGEGGQVRADRLFTVERMVAEFEGCYVSLAMQGHRRIVASSAPYARLLGLRW